ncbi:MAG: sugar nucleotide-binding protein [Nanoarchaeota archaeon]|nr:sugar nucleotide-binding protein [DPANN group archaeon]MBL7116994.1 sugar nucleotide-binding protein [Nanoarchaeota archaeon]
MEKIKKIKYLIFGDGYLGNKLNDFLDHSIISKVHIKSVDDVKKEIIKYNPEFVINSIGKVGKPNVDWCETHKSETLFANVIVPALMVEACQELNKKMVHLGTGCIYSGDNNSKGFSEEDEPNFDGSFYSRSKQMAEKILKEFNVLQIRLRMPVDSIPNKRNLITKILKFDKIINIPNSVTIIDDFLIAAKKLMDKSVTGIFNVVNQGPETHKELLDIYNEYSPVKKKFELIPEKELKNITLARRSNCVLSTKKLESLGIHLTETKRALKECVKKHVEFEEKKKK